MRKHTTNRARRGDVVALEPFDVRDETVRRIQLLRVESLVRQGAPEREIARITRAQFGPGLARSW